MHPVLATPCPMQPYAPAAICIETIIASWLLLLQHHSTACCYKAAPGMTPHIPYFMQPSSHQYFCPAMHLAQLQLT